MKTLALISLLILHFNLSMAAEVPSKVLVVDDFNSGTQNSLGGYFNKFEGGSSSATVGPTVDFFRGDAGMSLGIQANKAETGFCGAWIHFFDFRAEDKEYFDAGDYRYLSFWVKGAEGGEEFVVKLADKRWVELEDAMLVGPVGEFLEGGVQTTWSEVLIPFRKIRGVDLGELAGITFDFATEGRHEVFIDDIAFKTDREVLTPLTSATGPSEPESERNSATKRSVPPRVAWAWSVDEILNNVDGLQTRLFEFCERENVDRLWLQVPTRYVPDVDFDYTAVDGMPEGFRVELRHEDKLRAFIRKAHKRGIKVEALDGYPEFAQKEYHFVPLAIVDAIIDYNRRVAPEERYAGVHFDNEPYLIVGWHDPVRREKILREFIELNLECQRRIHENSDMIYGIDIPFWWSATDPWTGEAIGIVSYEGERKSAADFSIDHLDNVGIMNYRDSAFGADSMYAHGAPILTYAEQQGRKHIYSGVEVFSYEPTTVWFPLGLPRADFLDALNSNAGDLAFLSRINGFRTQTLHDGENVHVGIELPEDPDEATEAKIAETLWKIGERLGVRSREHPDARESLIKGATSRAVGADVEWRDFLPAPIKNPETGETIPGFKAVSIMLPKTTFADESYREFKQQIELLENQFSEFSSYRGTAIHYFKVLDEKYRSEKE
jgi:hypothetical protein